MGLHTYACLEVLSKLVTLVTGAHGTAGGVFTMMRASPVIFLTAVHNLHLYTCRRHHSIKLFYINEISYKVLDFYYSVWHQSNIVNIHFACKECVKCLFGLTVALLPISTKLESRITHTPERPRHVNTAVSTFNLTGYTLVYVWESTRLDNNKIRIHQC